MIELPFWVEKVETGVPIADGALCALPELWKNGRWVARVTMGGITLALIYSGSQSAEAAIEAARAKYGR